MKKYLGRSLVELWELALEKLKECPKHHGICDIVVFLHYYGKISIEERNLLSGDLDKLRPDNFHSDEVLWFKDHEERIKVIETRIERLKQAKTIKL